MDRIRKDLPRLFDNPVHPAQIVKMRLYFSTA